MSVSVIGGCLAQALVSQLQGHLSTVHLGTEGMCFVGDYWVMYSAACSPCSLTATSRPVFIPERPRAGAVEGRTLGYSGPPYTSLPSPHSPLPPSHRTVLECWTLLEVWSHQRGWQWRWENISNSPQIINFFSSGVLKWIYWNWEWCTQGWPQTLDRTCLSYPETSQATGTGAGSVGEHTWGKCSFL